MGADRLSRASDSPAQSPTCPGRWLAQPTCPLQKTTWPPCPGECAQKPARSPLATCFDKGSAPMYTAEFSLLPWESRSRLSSSWGINLLYGGCRDIFHSPCQSRQLSLPINLAKFATLKESSGSKRNSSYNLRKKKNSKSLLSLKHPPSKHAKI